MNRKKLMTMISFEKRVINCISNEILIIIYERIKYCTSTIISVLQINKQFKERDRHRDRKEISSKKE